MFQKGLYQVRHAQEPCIRNSC